MTNQPFRKDLFLLHLSVFFAGFTSVLGRLINLNEAILVWYRMAIAVVLIVIYLLITGNLAKYLFRNILKIGSVGPLLCLHWVFFYASIKAPNVSIGVVCFSMVGFFTALFEPIINRHRFSAREFLYSLLTVLGIYLIFQFDIRYRFGILLGILSAALYALFAIANQRVGKHYEAKNTLFWEMTGGLVGLTLLLPLYLHFIPTDKYLPSGQDLMYLGFMVIVCTIGLCLLQIIVLQKIDAFTVNLTYNLEPIYSILLSFAIFNEYKELNITFCFGIALIMLSVFITDPVRNEEAKTKLILTPRLLPDLITQVMWSNNPNKEDQRSNHHDIGNQIGRSKREMFRDYATAQNANAQTDIPRS